MSERHRNLIGGKWVDATTGTTFEDLNPANRGDVLGSFPRSDHRDVDRAVEAARARASDWRWVPAPRRAEILLRAGEILAERGAEIAALLTRETGKVLGESQAEVQEAVHTLRDIATGFGHFGTDPRPRERSRRIVTVVRVPLGTVGVITPWTFPVALPAARLALALVSGNTVVFKPAKDAPLGAVRLVEILQEAGIPPGVINVVHGYGEEAGAPLVRHPDVAAVSFTGSGEVAREAAIACAADRRGLLLERGQLGSALVNEDADLELAVEGGLWGALRLTGQRSAATARLFVHKKVLKEFTDRLLSRVQSLRPGDGLLPATDLGPLINEAQLKRVHSQTKLGMKEGAKVLFGGEIAREGDCKRGFFYAATVLAEATARMRLVKEETCGPILVLLSVPSLEEAIDWLNALRSSVCALLYTRDVGLGLRAAEALLSGSVSLNPPGDALRFSGTTGCPGGGLPGDPSVVLETLTAWKAVALHYGGADEAPPSAERRGAEPSRHEGTGKGGKVGGP